MARHAAHEGVLQGVDGGLLFLVGHTVSVPGLEPEHSRGGAIREVGET